MTIDEDTGAHWRPAPRGAWALFTDPTTPAGAAHRRGRHRPGVRVPACSIRPARVARPRGPVLARRLGAGRRALAAAGRPVHGHARPPAADRAGRARGLFVNTGYSGHGIMLGPAGSRLLADLLAGDLGPADNVSGPTGGRARVRRKPYRRPRVGRGAA